MTVYKADKTYVLGHVTCREYHRLDLVTRTHNGVTDVERISTGDMLVRSAQNRDKAIVEAIVKHGLGAQQ